jgi:hypothetical protein
MRSTAAAIELILPTAGHDAEALSARTPAVLVATLPWDGAAQSLSAEVRAAVISDARSLICVMII